MIDFEKIDGPYGVPVYYQRLPVRSVSLAWIVFVGSADDETAGEHGIYHWFEHLPSRGTKKFPGGYRDTEARLVRHGGSADAETGMTHTLFSADIPKRVWTEALDILTDMIAQPLLRTEDAQQEREIVLQEIDEWHSAPYSHSLCLLPGVLWPEHPFGHDQLGTHQSLQAMSLDSLKIAHEKGYSRNRLAFLIAGDIGRSEVLDTVADALTRMPLREVESRTIPANYGKLNSWNRGRETIHTQHAESVAYLLFPIPGWDKEHKMSNLFEWDFIEEVFQAGALGSPLSRMVREDARLAYSPEFISTTTPDGGYAGLVAQTSSDPRYVLDAFRRLIESTEIRSSEWLRYVRDTIRGGIEMRDPCSSDYVEESAASLIHYGRCLSDDDYSSRLLNFKDDQIRELLDSLSELESREIVFQGCQASNGFGGQP